MPTQSKNDSLRTQGTSAAQAPLLHRSRSSLIRAALLSCCASTAAASTNEQGGHLTWHGAAEGETTYQTISCDAVRDDLIGFNAPADFHDGANMDKPRLLFSSSGNELLLTTHAGTADEQRFGRLRDSQGINTSRHGELWRIELHDARIHTLGVDPFPPHTVTLNGKLQCIPTKY